MPLDITPEIMIDDDELLFRFIRAPGPGGQNVNKVATGVVLRFNVMESDALPEAVRDRLIALLGVKLTSSGELIIKAVRHRTQIRNKLDALERLRAWVLAAVPPPKKRKKTKPSKAVKAERLAQKKRRSVTKTRRRQDPFKEI